MTNAVPRKEVTTKKWYSMGKYREREIIYFCYQYPSWKKRATEIKIRGNYDEWSDPTAEEAIERTICEEKMRIVEDACKKVSPDNWEPLLLGVITPKSNFYNLKTRHNMTCGRDTYYEYVRQVHYLISLVRV